MADRVGQQLGNYRLVRLLGEGGFAEVYLGEHIHLGTPAAIKVLTTKLAEDEVEQFRNEARTMIGLKHPNIIRVLDFGLAGRIPFIVMEHAPNGPLRKIHPKGTRLPLSTIVNYVKQIAAALQYVHDQKLVHRDVKPENILLGHHNEVLLSDFGITAVAHSTRSLNTQDGSGTVYYMSPEQIQGKPRTLSDQYSLAIVAYEWLCGIRPFNGTYWEVTSQHLSTFPPSLRERIPTIPPAVEQVVMTALAKDPKQRFMSVQAFAIALEQASQVDTPTFVKPAAPTVLPHDMVPPSHSLAGTPATPPLAPTQIGVPRHIVGTALYTYHGHSNKVNTVAWSPDGRHIASAGRDKTVQVWNAADGSHMLTYKGHGYGDGVVAVAWSPDARKIASGGQDGAQVWNATDGNQMYTYHGHTGPVYAVAWSPDARKIASGSWDKTVQVWNATDGSHMFTYKKHTGWVRAVAWSPDARKIASGSWDKTVQVWNATDGSLLGTFLGHRGEVYAVAWSPDGKYIASGSWDKTIQVWNATDGSLLGTYRGHTNSVNAVAWSPDARKIASGSDDGTVQVWNATDGSHMLTYKGHTKWVSAVAWSPDGKRIASGGDDGTVQVWQASQA